MHELVIRDGGKIIIDGRIHKYNPRHNSENEKVLEYLYSHPRKYITKEEMKDKLKKLYDFSLGKDFTKTVENFKLTPEHREAFFPYLSAHKIYFRNPVYEDDLR